MELHHAGHCGRCAYRLSKGIDLLLPSQPSGIAAPRKDPPPVQTIPAQPKENTMAKPARTGTCPTCSRPNVTLTQTKAGNCFRCYDRIRKGHDPLGTGRADKKKGAEPAPEAPAPEAAATPPILKEKPVQPKPAPDACTIDVIQLLDDMWLEKRVIMVDQLSRSKSICSRLALANSYAERINALGV